MKRIGIISLAIILCLALTGCQDTAPDSSDPSDTSTQDGTIQTDESTAGTGGSDSSKPNDQDESTQVGELQLGTTGKIRVEYTGNRSSVIYVTSASALPDHAELSQYDEAWFADHALILVYETVTSGSVQVDIQSICLSDGIASVTLSHALPGDAGTADMATWLLWAEVDTGLNCRWTVENPAVSSNVSSS